MPKIYDIRANDTDYDGRIVIEMFSYWGRGEPSWAVPAWDERGEPQYEGPFSSMVEAEAVVEAGQ